MRTTLAVLAILIGAGCSSVTSNGFSNGGTPKKPDSGGTTTGGASPGAPCESNAACNSGVCGLAGSGNCCNAACSTSVAACAASGCNDGGACIYVEAGTDCGPASCSGQVPSRLQPQCDGHGSCSAESVTVCPYNLECDDAGAACIAQCTSSADCVTGLGLVCNGGVCVVPEPVGPCTENDDCTFGFCGPGGTGHCCSAQCSDVPPCGATDCDPFSGACVFPDESVTCSPASCDGGLILSAAGCNSQGACENPRVSNCAPYACEANACVGTCASNADCAGGYCDDTSASCCALPNGAQMAVDSTFGNDALACCGVGTTPCQTLAHALHLIDEAQARDVVITATGQR